MKEQRPHPLRVIAAAVGAANAVTLSVLPVLSAFDVIAWSGQQMGLVEAAIGTATSAIVGVIAVAKGEKQVTPVADPRDDGMVPLVPIADDWADD